MSTWRNKAATVISDVIQENPGMEPKELRKLISAAYPCGLKNKLERQQRETETV